MFKKLLKKNTIITIFSLIIIIIIIVCKKSYRYDIYLKNKKKNPICNLSTDYYHRSDDYKIKIDTREYELTEIESKLSKYSIKNGHWSPFSCKSKFKVAILIPYRDRLSNLKLFLLNMHQFFIKQFLFYTIYLIEPLENLTFNRGLLMNIGYLEAIKENDFDCFFFHDVDMIAEDQRNIYECDFNYPAHYAVAVSKHNNYSYNFLLIFKYKKIYIKFLVNT
jgi:hypothetical protein